MNIDYDHESRQFRGHQRHVQRTAKARLNIDPGFVHYRKIESFIGKHGINLVNAMVEKIPSGLPDYQPQLQVDHIYARVLVDICTINGIPPLIRALAADDVAAFRSVETCLPTEDLRDAARATTEVVAKGDSPPNATPCERSPTRDCCSNWRPGPEKVTPAPATTSEPPT